MPLLSRPGDILAVMDTLLEHPRQLVETSVPRDKHRDDDTVNSSSDQRLLGSFCAKCGLKISKPTLPGLLTGNEIVHLSASPSLEVLDLSKTVCKFDPVFIDALGRFKKLKTLKLGMLTHQQAQQLQALKDKSITLYYIIK
ncbi:MAG: hypothetical protein KGS72_13100 [Cyanobacteria bacterium REEB67]|nr:hypothetical protein [Cyanobacteria bacterium REEB67]